MDTHSPSHNAMPNRASGLDQLNRFVPFAGLDYARLRNSDFGAGKHTHVSNLSPYIRHRLITEQEVIEQVLDVHDIKQSEKFIQEVFWRTYFKGWLEHRPRIWTDYQAGLEDCLSRMSTDKTLKTRYETAVLGRTNIACFDDWTRELIDTGYLHNHSRMWFASIWIFTLKLPWELGADFFLRHLIDGDPASNTLSWRWVGGLHTKGKTYLARPDNITRFTNNRYKPHGQLSPQADPLIEPEDLRPPRPLPDTQLLPEDPFLFLIHEDDCRPETLIPPHHNNDHIIGALATPLRSPLGVQANVIDYARRAVTDAMDRMQVDPDLIEGNWAKTLLEICKRKELKHIVTAYAPTGPVAQALNRALPELNTSGIEVRQIVRPWDSAAWPYADRGFFKLKKKIPNILKKLDINQRQGELF